MNTIEIIWVPITEEMMKYNPFSGGKEMRVLKSTHKRFSEGSRFDFGFMQIASEEGYKIILHPKS